ncbi:MAG: hypothetical protein R3304_12490 [Longimicrobiales bacterium]|nr:hypothetical protein [Longimicrobiales bacterium]
MPSLLKDRRTAYVVVGLVAGVVYLSALPNSFAYDDVQIVLNNTAIQSLESLPGALLEPYWPMEYGEDLGLWRPVTTALFGLEWVMGGGSPLLFHAVNVVAHVGTSILVLALLVELLPLAAAFAGGLLFAVHPVHVEAVANIVGLSEIVSTACVVGACLVHLRSGERSGWRAAAVVGLLYLIGFGAKESAVTLPGLLLLLDAARRRIPLHDLPRYVSARWRVYVTMAVVAGSLLTARFFVLGTVATAHAPIGADLLREIPRIWTLGEVWMHYVRLWVFPLDLSADYSPGVIPVSFGWQMENVLGVGLVLLLLALALALWRAPGMERGRSTTKAVAFGLVWFLIAIAPTSNTVILSGILLAERTLYLPSVGLAAATGWLVLRLAERRRRLAWAGLTVIVLAAGLRVWTRNPEWYDNATVYTALIRDYPQSGRSQWILGDVLMGRGRESEALLAYRAAIDLLGTHYKLVTEISRKLMAAGHYGAAEVLLGFAAEDIPRYSLAPALLALVRAERGDARGAEEYARRALDLEPQDPTRLHLLAWALAAQGRFAEAREVRRKAEALADAFFWQQYVYEAYAHRQAGDTARMREALDSARVRTFSHVGRRALDSIRVVEFDLERHPDDPDEAGS